MKRLAQNDYHFHKIMQLTSSELESKIVYISVSQLQQETASVGWNWEGGHWPYVNAVSILSQPQGSYHV
jgi:hypothetical protein